LPRLKQTAVPVPRCRARYQNRGESGWFERQQNLHADRGGATHHHFTPALLFTLESLAGKKTCIEKKDHENLT